MNVWLEHHVPGRVLEVIDAVPVNERAHAFGRPYVTAYQLAIALDAIHPGIRQALGLPLGGVGVGDQHSFAQYLANQLSSHIRANPDHFPVEGAFLSNQHVAEMTFDGPIGPIAASFLENGADLSMFRRRPGA